jgi:hypothetical protein
VNTTKNEKNFRARKLPEQLSGFVGRETLEQHQFVIYAFFSITICIL